MPYFYDDVLPETGAWLGVVIQRDLTCAERAKEAFLMASATTIKRLQQLIWVLIYGGLLTVALGLTLEKNDDASGASWVMGGGLVAALGFVLIYVRSRMTID